MEFRLLGPVGASGDGGTLAVGPRKRRLLLAVLALEANRLVTVERLIDLLWPDDPPVSARGTVQAHISGLRTTLNAAGASGDGVSLRREGSGYLLVCDPATVDAHRFTALTRCVAEETDPRRQLEFLDDALALWRGPALADVAAEPERRKLCHHLEEAKLLAIEHRLHVLMDLGHHDQTVGELTRLAETYPDRHRITELHMTALHRAGRPHEALLAYQEAKRRMADELGLDPPARLQDLELSILRDAPAPLPPLERALTIPAQLPADVSAFTGRADALAQLDNLLTRAHTAADAVAIAVVSGTAGVGKTALAVHWAHQVRTEFPDGQLQVDLRGFDPGGQGVDPSTALRGFLDALQVPAQRIPADLDSQASLYRSLLAGQRMLVVLDNARDTTQVRALLPGTPGCLAVVTSRTPLTSLIAQYGAHPITLDLLPDAEARDLLSHRLGRERVAAAPEAVDEIITRCARLPLALSLAAARAATRAHIALTDLAEELRDTQPRWSTLAGDDPSTDVRSVFSWSYQALTAPAARLFRLLGLGYGPDVTVHAAASLAALDPAEVRPQLAELVQANLLTEYAQGRYALHDLLCTYAGELARIHDPQPVTDDAQHRLLDHYLHTAQAAALQLEPRCGPVVTTTPHPGTQLPDVNDYQRAITWSVAEHATLTAMIRLAADLGWDACTWQLTWTAWCLYRQRDARHDWIATHETALALAQRSDDRRGQIYAHRGLGLAHAQAGHFSAAHDHLQRGIKLSHQSPAVSGEAEIHLDLAKLFEAQMNFQSALSQARQALNHCLDEDDKGGQAHALNMIGWFHTHLGDHEPALIACHQAIAGFQELGDLDGQAATWDSLGLAYHRLGRHQESSDCYARAIQIFRELGDHFYQAQILIHLGDAHAAAGDPAARTAWQHALTILTALDHPAAGSVRTKIAAHTSPGTD